MIIKNDLDRKDRKEKILQNEIHLNCLPNIKNEIEIGVSIQLYTKNGGGCRLVMNYLLDTNSNHAVTLVTCNFR